MARVTFNEYHAARGSQFTDEDAQVIGPVLEDLAKAGKSSAPAVVDAARAKSSPLHGYFEWNDAKAAESHRENQAREMMRAVVVVRTLREDEPKQEVRAFFPVHRTREAKEAKEPRQYVHIDSVLDDPELAEQVVADALRMLRAWRNRFDIYRTIFPSEWSPVFEVVDTVAADEAVAA